MDLGWGKCRNENCHTPRTPIRLRGGDMLLVVRLVDQDTSAEQKEYIEAIVADVLEQDPFVESFTVVAPREDRFIQVVRTLGKSC